jgi:hypothetical protein
MSCSSPCASPERRRWLRAGLAATCLASTCLPATVPAQTQTSRPAPPEIATALKTAQLQGAGGFRWWGLLIYEASLWVDKALKPGRYTEAPFALQLQYARALEGQQIAERSLVEMRRVGSFDEPLGQRWLAQMGRAFPNVVAGDRLVGVHQPGQATQFFCNGTPTGSVAEPAFAALFFGIWLSDRGPEPVLRRALYGNAA